MEFIVSVPTYKDDLASQSIWHEISALLGDVDGICYYRHPIIMSSTRAVPDLTLIAYKYQPLVVSCITLRIDDLNQIDANEWMVNGIRRQAPTLDLEDYCLGLQYKFDKDRTVRNLFSPVGVLALPLISKADFEQKFGGSPDFCQCIWSDINANDVLQPIESDITKRQWAMAKSIFQGISSLNRGSGEAPTKAETLGEAILALEKDIALLDTEQHKVAVQIAPGPQRIRGLAGTGKTVILAMKAANIHMHYPDKRILFTFHTQSLYNQARSLITRFYRANNDEDPDWNMIHVRHAWGGTTKPGVYYDACRRMGLHALTLDEAKHVNLRSPFTACCNHILDVPGIQPYYDYILVDEAQDFPPRFFQLLVQLTDEEKRICWAYDELQTLSNLEVPTARELFGRRPNGVDVVSLDGEDYAGGIEKDFVLHRSYRCPREILMLAHGIGLGIHSSGTCVQMLASKASWETIGYEIQKGDFQIGDETIISRPIENSPNRIAQIYQGPQQVVTIGKFASRDEELEAVADNIAEDLLNEKVLPEQIVVICLDKNSRPHLTALQMKLIERGIRNKTPGLVDAASDFAEIGAVTLTSVHRAKGNEASVVYITNFDNLAKYAEEIEARNRAFTSISRSKGWVRLSGCGKDMDKIGDELAKILKDIPLLKFIFPDMDKIRNLDAETSRRKINVKHAGSAMKKLLNLDIEAVAANPEELKRLRALLDQIEDADK